MLDVHAQTSSSFSHKLLIHNASVNTADGSFRPDAIKFDHDGNNIYVTSNGIIQERTITPNGAVLPLETTWMYTNTGIIWKITRVRQ